MSMDWDGWKHFTGSTCGTWPRGEEKGWRARHHREHVIGDYRTPPPNGMYDKELALSKRLMKRERVVLTWEQWVMACRVIAESLISDGVELGEVAVGAKHWHSLARHPEVPAKSKNAPAGDDPPRFFMGRAKGRSARALSKAGLVPLGGVWAVRCRPVRVKDDKHLANVKRYLRDHAAKGAAVWSILLEQEQRTPTRG